MTHLCVGKLTHIASDNGLSPGRRQAIIWTNAGMLSIGPLGTNFSEILSEIHTFSFKKMRLKMSSAKWRPFCLGLNVLMAPWTIVDLKSVRPISIHLGAMSFEMLKIYHSLKCVCKLENYFSHISHLSFVCNAGVLTTELSGLHKSVDTFGCYTTVIYVKILYWWLSARLQ